MYLRYFIPVKTMHSRFLIGPLYFSGFSPKLLQALAYSLWDPLTDCLFPLRTYRLLASIARHSQWCAIPLPVAFWFPLEDFSLTFPSSWLHVQLPEHSLPTFFIMFLSVQIARSSRLFPFYTLQVIALPLISIPSRYLGNLPAFPFLIGIQHSWHPRGYQIPSSCS